MTWWNNSLKTVVCGLAMVCGALAVGGGVAAGGDWPQILGPNRNGVAVDETIASAWPARPTILWTRPLGQGYAGPAVSGQQVYAFYRQGRRNMLAAFDKRTGDPLWQTSFEATYQGGVDADLGPRSVPLVTRQRIVLWEPAGMAHAVDQQTGKTIWSRDLLGDFDAREGYFGAGSSPIAVGDDVLVNVGGDDSSVVAISLQDGKTRWAAVDDDASYASPTLVPRPDGTAQVLFITRLNAVLLEPRTGRVLLQLPFGKRGPTVNAATPIPAGKTYFLTASYGVGAVLLDPSQPKQPVVWRNDESLSSQYNTPVYHEGYLYGIHGREDVGQAELRCVSSSSGAVEWREPGFGVAHLLLVGDRLLILKIDGTLVLADATASGFHTRDSLQLGTGPFRALPALSDGVLYVKTQAGGGQLLAVDLRPASSK